MRHLALCAAALVAMTTSSGYAEPRATPSSAKARKAPTAVVVLVEYQRVGRELLKLQETRGTETCRDLWKHFRGLHIEQAVQTTESRAAAFDELVELRARVERQRGIDVSAECLHNPLAASCTPLTIGSR